MRMSLRYSINLSMLYTEHSFLERFGKAAEAGFSAVEFHFPYDFDIPDIKSRLDGLGLLPVVMNLHPGDTGAGEWGTLSNPKRRAYLHWSFTQGLEVATFLGCARINMMLGCTVPGVALDVQVGCAAENLAWAAPLAQQAGITLLIEPLNAVDFPRCILHRPAEALGLVKQVGHPQVKVQYDVYHAQMSEGNLIGTLMNHSADIGHIQVADVPGRHQPGTGEINYPAVLEALRKLDYSGYVGLEYIPSSDTASSLTWLAREERCQTSSGMPGEQGLTFKIGNCSSNSP